MRATFLTFATVTAIVAVTLGSTAFNYAQVGNRNVFSSIVQDDSAVIAIAGQDSAYSCYVRFDATKGTIAVTFDAGSPSCSGGASGLNPESKYTFEDILKVTNKGQKDWQRLWVNSTDALVTVNLTYSSDPTMTTGSTFAQNAAFGSAVTIGSTVYVGLRLDGSSKDKGYWYTNLTFEARASA